MSRLVKAILSPTTKDPDGGHPSDEDLARLAEGVVDGQERERLAKHVNRCERCEKVLSDTMADIESSRAKSQAWWANNSRQLVAVAASVIMVVLVGHTLFNFQSGQPTPMNAPLPTESEMRDVKPASPKPDREPSIATLKQVPGLEAKKATRVGSSKPAPTPDSGETAGGVHSKQAPRPKPQPTKRVVVEAVPRQEPNDTTTGVRAKQAPRPKPSAADRGMSAMQAPEAKPRSESMRLRFGAAPRAKSGRAKEPAPGIQAARPKLGRAAEGDVGQGWQEASLPMDRNLRDLVLQGSQQGWDTGDFTARLVAELNKRGLVVDKVRQVVMVGRHLPTKAPPAHLEVLKIRMRDGLIYLKVIEAKD